MPGLGQNLRPADQVGQASQQVILVAAQPGPVQRSGQAEAVLVIDGFPDVGQGLGR